MLHAMLSLVATAFATSALAGAPLPTPDRAQECGRFRGHWSSTRDNGHRSITRISDAAHCLEVVVEGQVDFTDDDADVLRLTPGGLFSVDETRGATRRRVEIEERGGRLERAYWVNGERRPAEEAAGWLREVIPAVARESVAGADRRAERVLRTRGARGVFDEVAQIASDQVKAIYLTKVVDTGRPGADVLREVARVAGERIVSDSKKGDVLRHVAARAGGDASVLEGVATAAGRIVSDSEKSRVLLDVVAATNDARVHTAAATVARRIVSDSRRGEVLASLSARTGESTELRDAYFRVTREMVSDAERRRALVAALEAGGTQPADPATLASALETARQMVSDSERGQVLRAAVARGALATSSTRDPLFRAVDGMVSDGEKTRVLVAVANRSDAGAQAVTAALRSAGRLMSDNSKATVLLELATRTPALRDSTTRTAFFDALRTVSSSGEYRRVMEAVLR